jgi:hypothetical protein
VCRLVDRVYPDHSSIEDYIALLRAKEHEQTSPVSSWCPRLRSCRQHPVIFTPCCIYFTQHEAIKRMRITPGALKKEIGEF